MYYNKKCAKVTALIVMLLIFFNFTFTAKSENKITTKSTLKNVERINDYLKIAENDNLELYLNESNLGIKVLNKKTGFIWDSILNNPDPDLNEEWQGFASSAVTVEYMDSTYNTSRLFLNNFDVNINTDKKPDGFTSQIEFLNEGISFSIEVVLKDDYVDIKIPYSSIKEANDEYKIQNIYIYPFFGAIKGNKSNSFMFIPDGSGVLINLGKDSVATQPYMGRVYGDDLGLKEMFSGGASPKYDLTLPIEKVYMPVFGYINENNKNAFLASIEGGAPYAEIQAYRKGMITDYNWVCSKFIYRETYKQLIDKKGNGITANQKEKNKFDAELKFAFLGDNDANYVGMAKRYQKDLIDKGILNKKDSPRSEIPLRIEFLMAENKKVFFWKKVIYMTRFEDIKNILKELRDKGIDNFNVVLKGYTKKGITDSSPKHLPFSSKLGSLDDIKNIIKEGKGNVYLFADYTKAYRKGRGYGKSDVALTISDQLITTSYNNYLLNPNSTKRIFSNEVKEFNKLGFSNLALDSIGNILYSSYNSKEISRQEAIDIYQSMLSNENNYAFYKPNLYLWKFSKDIFNVPMGSSSFLIENETVPFMQIVLKGYIDYYAPPLNFSSDIKLDTLKMIDYGCYPAFYLTQESPVKLLDTESAWLYTSEYKVWKDKIIEEYKIINNILKQVEGSEIIGRSNIKDGIVKVDYSNGVSILINYTNTDYNYNNTNVASKNYAVIRGNVK